MAYWIRDATLTIGNNKYTLGNLNFTFEVPFEDSDEPPVATIKVMNLSHSTRAGIKKDDPVILNAGYEGDVSCILIGKVVGLKHNQSNVDWTSTLTVQPCADEILNGLINKTYTENITAKAMVRDLLNIFGVEVGKFELSLDKTYPRGKVCRGNLKQILTEIVVSDCKSRLVVRPTGQIYITKIEDGINNGLLLTPQTGLLRSNEDKIVIPIETEKNTQKTGEERKEDYISRSCLLHYGIAPAEVVKFQSADLNGKLIVAKGKHTGSLTGDWKTSMELRQFTSSETTQAVNAAAVVASTKASTASKETVKFGSRGDSVKELQTLLNRNGANLSTDGIYGQDTRAAVIAYQESHGLNAGGVVGSEMWASLMGGG